MEESLSRLKLERDRLTAEVKVLRRQNEQLVEANHQLKSELDNLRQLQFREQATDWMSEYHALQERYSRLENEAGRFEEKAAYWRARCEALEQQQAADLRRRSCW